MNPDREPPSPLREALAPILIDGAEIGEPRNTGDFLSLVTSAAALRTEADSLLHTAVVSSRDAGVTWQSIGATLGMTKQAAQKRFARPAAPHPPELDADERTIGPTTTFDGMKELALAGRYGWHSVNSARPITVSSVPIPNGSIFELRSRRRGSRNSWQTGGN